MLPSIATSTAVVGGLMCLELYKLVQGKPFTLHKHAYFNLAVPLFAFAQPIKALQHTVLRFLSFFCKDFDCGLSFVGFNSKKFAIFFCE